MEWVYNEIEQIKAHARDKSARDLDELMILVEALLIGVEHVTKHLKMMEEIGTCCEKETRNLNGSCDNCGDPCL
jgi:hypothetical protein